MPIQLKTIFCLFLFVGSMFHTRISVFGKIVELRYFDFSLEKYSISNDNDVDVTLLFDIGAVPPERFLVRPHVQPGSIKIWNYGTQSWVNGTEVWSALPTLSPKVVVSFTVLGKSDLWFDILDTHSGKIYSTEKKVIIGHSYTANYVKRLNENVWRLSALEEEERESSAVPLLSTKEPGASTPWIILGAAVITVFTFFQNKQLRAMLEYLYAFFEKMASRYFGSFTYICFVISAWGFGFG